MDIVFCDRLEVLDNKESNHRLHVASEVIIHTAIQSNASYGPGYILGRADWALGYGTNKAELDSMLVIVEAKKQGHTTTALAQALSYLAGVQDARKNSGKLNYDIFGVLTDFGYFQFVVLRSNRRLYVSAPLWWVTDRGLIITFLDHIFQKAIQSSPYTIPVKTNNKNIVRYDQYLRETFDFGTSDFEDDEDEDGEELRNIVIVDKKSCLEQA
jgi:hypothetical protein